MSCHAKVVVLHWDRGEDGFDEPLPFIPTTAVGEFHPDQELGGGDRGDGDVVLVRDDRIK